MKVIKFLKVILLILPILIEAYDRERRVRVG